MRNVFGPGFESLQLHQKGTPNRFPFYFPTRLGDLGMDRILNRDFCLINFCPSIFLAGRSDWLTQSEKDQVRKVILQMDKVERPHGLTKPLHASPTVVNGSEDKLIIRLDVVLKRELLISEKM